jgi:lipopolysaccharide/colanic/teichoic acid biosynthesis glycosyltransferase
LQAKSCASKSFEPATLQQPCLLNDGEGQPGRLSIVKGHVSSVASMAASDAAYQRLSVSQWSLSRSKRLFDVAIALPILAVFALPMILIAICVRLTSRGPAIFVQERVGRHGRLFSIYKFRSMTVADGEASGLGLTKDGDCRITALGRWLRKLKLDELPQLLNVLRGDLSLVGPRPKLPQYEVVFNMPYRPGITGVSTLAFRNEEEILSRVPADELEDFYDRRIKPLKARMDARYMKRATFGSDLRMIWATLLSCVAPGRAPAVSRPTPSPVAQSRQSPHLDYTAQESFETTS